MKRQSFRKTKKKFKAENMRRQMDAMSVMPTFVANAKFFRDIVEFFGLRPTGYLIGAPGLDCMDLFDRDLETVKKAYPPAFKFMWDNDLRDYLRKSAHIAEPSVDVSTISRKYGLMNHNIKLNY